MARGKQTCKILKEIRRQIAEANDIEFITSECRYKGDCLGTCPKCEAEVRYLEQQLRARSLAGKSVTLAGISAGLILMSGCSGTSSNQSSETLRGEPIAPVEQIDTIDCLAEEGELPLAEDTVTIKKGGIEPNEVVKQGEMPDERPNNQGEKVIYTVVEQMPQFPGGPSEMLRFIGQHLKYPEGMVDDFQGRVSVKFYVDTLGHVCDPQIVRGLDSALDREVLRVVKMFPDFVPGQHEGKKVNVYMILPISFDPNRY